MATLSKIPFFILSQVSPFEIKPGDFRERSDKRQHTAEHTIRHSFGFLFSLSPFILADLASNGVVASSNTSSIGTQNYYRE